MGNSSVSNALKSINDNNERDLPILKSLNLGTVFLLNSLYLHLKILTSSKLFNCAKIFTYNSSI